jgi:hypothetical protein
LPIANTDVRRMLAIHRSCQSSMAN